MKHSVHIFTLTGLIFSLGIVDCMAQNAQTRNPWAPLQQNQQYPGGNNSQWNPPLQPAPTWQAPVIDRRNTGQANNGQYGQQQPNGNQYVPLPGSQNYRQPWQGNNWQRNSRQQSGNQNSRQRNNNGAYQNQSPWSGGQGGFGWQMGFGSSFNPGFGYPGTPNGSGFPGAFGMPNPGGMGFPMF